MFAIRHKATGNLLSWHKGATWWEGQSGPVPRIFSTKKAATSFVVIWAFGRASVKHSYRGVFDTDESPGIEYENRGRTRDMLEIIPVTLTFGEPL